MAAQNFKEEDWGNRDTKLGQNWHKNFQACILKLIQDKMMAMMEVHRNLKELGHFSNFNGCACKNHRKCYGYCSLRNFV